MHPNMRYATAGLGLVLALGGCTSIEHLGRPPKLSPMAEIESPAAEASLSQQALLDRGVASGGPVATPVPGQSASLFRTGAGALFKDQRAARVGDVLTVRINIADRASVDNTTTRTRDGSESAGITNLFGLEKTVAKHTGIDPANLIGGNSSSSSTGAGNTTRSETVNMTVAAVVTALLPNGNLVIRGRQETRVNFELRELLVSGIVRPQDIARDNSIRHTQIAEARISYGGRGQLTDAQQARWGQQLMDIISPF